MHLFSNRKQLTCDFMIALPFPIGLRKPRVAVYAFHGCVLRFTAFWVSSMIRVLQTSVTRRVCFVCYNNTVMPLNLQFVTLFH